MPSDLRECYRIIEVEPGAPPEEVKRSYRELVKVWHPDRFAHDPNLQRKAQEKLKQINLAYERICESGPLLPVEGTSKPAVEKTVARSDAPPPRPAPARSQEAIWNRKFGWLAVALAVIVVARAVFFTTGSSPPRSVRHQEPSAAPGPTLQTPSTDAQPKPRQHLSVAQISALHQEALKKQPAPGLTLQEFSRSAQETMPDYDFSEGINLLPAHDVPQDAGASAHARPPPVVAPDAAAATRGGTTEDIGGMADASKPSVVMIAGREHFTVGSTREEVLAVQGAPSEFTDSTFIYGSSYVYFLNGRVKTWENNRSNPLRVILLPVAEVAPKEYFTVGSTRDEVLAVQGTPSEFTEAAFTYGSSYVYFQGGRVRTWEDNRSSPLRVKLLPAAGVASKGYFTVGSTKDEVLAVQGTPSEFTSSTFTYGFSHVHFQNGRVTTWDSSRSDPLKAKLEK